MLIAKDCFTHLGFGLKQWSVPIPGRHVIYARIHWRYQFMLHLVRKVLIAAFASLMLSGLAATVYAEGADQAVTECTKQAQDNGLDGAEKSDFIKSCVESAKAN
jgi:hypothetical protein